MDLQRVIELIAAVAGGAGVGQLIRAWGQNRNERHGTLTSEQRDFRESQRDAIKDLRDAAQDSEKREQYLLGRLDAIDTRNAQLVSENAQLLINARLQEEKNDRLIDQLTVSQGLRENQVRTMAALQATVETQAGEIKRLQDQVVSLQDEIAQLRRSSDLVSGD